MQHVHILGICGTFMGSLALLAKELGLQVTGQDQHVYPPMSTQLETAGIQLIQGYASRDMPEADLYVVGNAISRGNEALEEILNKGLPYISGPQFLAEHVLPERWVVAVAGTHGKTTTASMVAWVLEKNGLSPGFLIGGVPQNFTASARLGATPFFVVEADEYDTAFSDKRSKFVHYRPRTAILNNLEFDHADIFADLAAIQTQFHHFVRIVPSQGQIILPVGEQALEEVLEKGCWSEVVRFGTDGDVNVQLLSADGSAFAVSKAAETVEVHWGLTGTHNVNNGVAALLAAHHCGVTLADGAEALSQFVGVKRRMEHLGTVGGVTVYDDFAHHPTAIETTLSGIRKQLGDGANIVALIEPRSNTMRMGVHAGRLMPSVAQASAAWWYEPEGLEWTLLEELADSPVPSTLFHSLEDIVEAAVALPENTHLVIMSNGSFGGVHAQIIAALEAKEA
ncbi:MAG TPA: UDP-N-acetylmuramate:L-alanyl-gamma-D-glutamyl-meso-diaminopimelate ligase [Alcanivoracaceae bacterium]|nr:UDP-N-acetylmuramate:L-alanyl-gamma-D-glutamyl-meso-diaminopimelate ligase [Alcanivoracaceae bacterium]